MNMNVNIIQPDTFLILNKVNEDSNETIPVTLNSGSNSDAGGRAAVLVEEPTVKMARPPRGNVSAADEGVVYLPSIVPRKSQQSKLRRKNHS